MAQQEEVVVLQLKTIDAVNNVQDLKNNIKILKDQLGELEIGSQEYQNTLGELRLNQNALKDAMYATSATMEDVRQSAQGAGESYNALVHRMAALKEEFRATTDAARRLDLGVQIKEVNDQLKSLDALQGNFQRNVGNYTESIKAAFAEIPEYAGPVKKAFESVDKSMGVLTKNPLIGTITILFPLIVKITEELKQNTTAVEAIDKAMKALQPVFDFLGGIIQKLADYLADIIGRITEAVSSNGVLKKVINAIVGVGNAILQYVIAPFKAVIAAIKVFQDEGLKGIRNAASAFANEWKSGFAFKQNFEAGQAVAEALASGVKSKKEEVKKEIKKAVEDGIKAIDLSNLDDKMDETIKRNKERNDAKAADDKLWSDLEKEQNEDTIEVVDSMWNEAFENLQKQREKDLAHEKEIQEAKVSTLFGVADATASVLGSMADMYEADAEENEKSAKKAKALRIASATIETISGAVGAYMQAAATIPPPYGIILGAIQAATVTATGLVNIAKMKSTNVSASGSTTRSVGATVSAPSINMGVPQTSIINSNSQEEMLNQMASEQKVYILQSDIEAAGRSSKVRVAEASY